MKQLAIMSGYGYVGYTLIQILDMIWNLNYIPATPDQKLNTLIMFLVLGVTSGLVYIGDSIRARSK